MGAGLRASTLATITCLVAISGCGAPPAERPSAAAGQPRVERSAPAGRAIDPNQSELRLLVYRAGPLAALGHNHVIVNRTLTGSVRVAPDGRSAAFEMTIPADGFDVDPSRARAEEGADFPGEIDADARAGTLRNMLGPALLDAQHHPAIRLDGEAVVGADDRGRALVHARLAGHDATFTAPFELLRGSGPLRVRGALSLRQSALGLTPFSALLGALAVRDDFTAKFDLSIAQ